MNHFDFERVRQLYEQGFLTSDSPIYLDGFRLGEDEGESEYRPDGWSYETSNGCRRHRAIDEERARLEAEGHDLSDYPTWFCFDPMDLAGFSDMRAWLNSDPDYRHPIESEDEDERTRAARAAFIRRWVVRVSGAPNDLMEPFWISEDTNGDGIRERTDLPDYAVVFAADRSDRAEIVDRWPEHAIRNLRNLANADGQSDWHTP